MGYRPIFMISVLHCVLAGKGFFKFAIIYIVLAKATSLYTLSPFEGTTKHLKSMSQVPLSNTAMAGHLYMCEVFSGSLISLWPCLGKPIANVQFDLG